MNNRLLNAEYLFCVYWDILFIFGNNCEAQMQLYAIELIDEIPGKKRVSKKNKTSSNNRCYFFLIKEFVHRIWPYQSMS